MSWVYFGSIGMHRKAKTPKQKLNKTFVCPLIGQKGRKLLTDLAEICRPGLSHSVSLHLVTFFGWQKL